MDLGMPITMSIGVMMSMWLRITMSNLKRLKKVFKDWMQEILAAEVKGNSKT